MMSSNSSEYRNYDFGANWHTVVSPLFATDIMKQQITQACKEWYEDDQSYFDDDGNRQQYVHYEPPAAFLSSGSGYAETCLNLHNELVEARDGGDRNRFKKLKYLVRPFNIDYKPELHHFIGHGSCHYTNRFISYGLAKLIFPDVDYEVCESDTHTTVVCHDRKAVFDLLYWALDGRLNSYLDIGETYNRDPTLGGALAVRSACDN